MSSSHYRYNVYGLSLDAAIPLPELICESLDGLGDTSTGEVEVRLGEVNSTAPDAVCIGPSQWATATSVWFHYDGVCRMQVRDGREILVEPASAADDWAIRLSVLGNGLGAILHQRGLLVLHAGAVCIDDKAVAFLGFSGAGKSTMTAAMVDRGYRLVADDMVVVDMAESESPVVYPGYARMKLHPEVAEALDCPPSSLRPLHPYSDKFDHSAANIVPSTPLPLGAAYILEASTSENIAIARLKPASAILELIRHSYAAQLLRAQPSARHFQQCGSLARLLPVSILTRPLRLQDLPRVAELIERDRLCPP